VLSSAGPCFLPVLFPDEAPRFAELNAYLQSVGQIYPLSSGIAKDYLWWIYTSGINEPGGISAMPSMHNAQAALFVVAGYRLNRRLGHLLLAYAIVIFVGSVHLAWHYAVDGIAGAILALVIWWVAGLATASRKLEPLGTA
jgi:membrane-associated phospholipid phosphatase